MAWTRRGPDPFTPPEPDMPDMASMTQKEQMVANLKMWQTIHMNKMREYLLESTIMEEWARHINPKKQGIEVRKRQKKETDEIYMKPCLQSQKVISDLIDNLRKLEVMEGTYIHKSVFDNAFNEILKTIGRRLHGKPELDLVLQDIRTIAATLAPKRTGE